MQYEKYLFELLETFAYCLLPNHYHLLVRPKVNNPEKISEQFRKLFISYSMSINKQEKRKGNLFQRGFKRKIIENEKYFYSAVYYIHSNAIHHGLVNDLAKYKFSSYNSLISNKSTKLCRDEVLEWFGGYKNFVEEHKNIQHKYFNDNYIIDED
jgi:REP element-mobilizing transposase RayT